MKTFSQPSGIRQDGAGTVSIRANCTPDMIRDLDFDTYFGANARHKSIFIRRETLEARAAAANTNVILAVTDDGRIAGFGVFGPPADDDRWSQMRPGLLMEVEVVEVHHRFRRDRVAGGMIRQMLTHPRIETMIAFMVGYSWTWDLERTGLRADAYRHILVRLFSAFGFKEFKTNEPNICLRPENLFMARIGCGVSEALREAFKYLRFGVPLSGS